MTDVSVVELPERLDITGVEALHLELEQALSAGGPVSLQGQQVVKLDTAGVQLLEAFITEAKKHHQDITWLEPSETIREVFQFLNLSASVGLSDQQEQINE